MTPPLPPPPTAWVVLVPEAGAVVNALRQRFDPAAQLGVPAHITVLYPFMPPADITREVLARAAAAIAGIPAFGFVLNAVGRFPATTYLAPEPAAPFVALTQALVQAFPGFVPYSGAHDAIVPHLTVAHGDAGDAQQAAVELADALRRHGPIEAHCSRLSLLEYTGGRWRERTRLPLRS